MTVQDEPAHNEQQPVQNGQPPVKNGQHPITFTDRVRKVTNGLMARAGSRVHKLGIHPDTITIFGTVIVGIAGLFIAAGEFQWGGVLLLLSFPMDALDGAVARAMKRQDRFGEMLDSSLDRYADGFIFGALSYYFAVQDEFSWMALALAALIGSFMVSYARARGEGVGVIVKIGLFSRLERVLTTLIMLLFPAAFGLPVLKIGVLILAVGTNFTGLQRLWYVYRALKRHQGE